MLAKSNRMYKINFSVKVFLRSNKNKDNTQTVGLRVMYLGKSKDYSIGIKITAKEYDQIKKGYNIRNPYLLKIKFQIDEAKNKANNVIKELENDFSFSRFEDKYFGTNDAKNGLRSIIGVIDEYINSKNNKLSTNLGYETLKNKIHQFNGNVSVKEIEETYFQKFKSYLYENGLSDNTVIVNLRYLKAALRYAQEKGYIKSFKLKIDSAKNIKSRGYYLTEPQSSLLFTYCPSCYYEERALDFFKMSIQMYGANIIDILSLKNQNISHAEIKFYRTKVKSTSKGGLIKVNLSDELRGLIEKYRENNLQDDYLFSILSGKSSERERRNAVNAFNRNINKYLKKISYKIGLETPITTYWARHTFSMFMLNNLRAKPADLKEFLGHTSIESTEHYIHNRFNKDEITKSLTYFIHRDKEATIV